MTYPLTVAPATAFYNPSSSGRLSTESNNLDWNLTPPSWHPKLSPYRLIVLTTTVGLGSAKAVLSQRGSTVAPITLEWILGTGIFLLLFSVSAYDSREDVPHSLSWLFEPDCMDLAWPILATLSIRPPQYVSSENLPVSSPYQKHPPITSYRILVCSAVASFGMSKALLGYFGLSTAVTWTDWVLAVPITTCLYVLGLYEYNSLNIWPSFFFLDQSEILFSVRTGMKNTASVFLCLAWITGWGYALRYLCLLSDWHIMTTDRDDRNISWRTQIEELTPDGSILLCIQFIIIAIAGGIAVLFLVLRSMVTDVASKGGLVRRVVRILRRPVLRLIWRVVPSPPEVTLQTWRFSYSRYRSWRIIGLINLLIRLLVHIVLHLWYITGCCSFALMFSQLLFISFDMATDLRDPLFMRTASCFVFALILLMTLGFMLGALGITLSMLSPILLYFWDAQSLNDASIRLRLYSGT